jgi:hypothetical protein
MSASVEDENNVEYGIPGRVKTGPSINLLF